jgi:hypothetical protein
MLVSSRDRPVFGRVKGLMSTPALLPFDLPVAAGRLTVRIPDVAVASSVTAVEIAAKVVVPLAARDGATVRTVERLPERPDGAITYVDDHAYPEGGVFWTRGTERAVVLVSPDAASRIVLTLHLGPNTGVVELDVAGKRRTIDVPANGVVKVPIDVPTDARFVSLGARSPVQFIPAEVDPAARDTRRLGVQVRINLE